MQTNQSVNSAGSLVARVREAGVVGAGGGGFPTHVKLAAKAETVIANGAECEPLLHKDAAIMEHEAAAIVRGMLLSMEAVGAREGVVGIKAKNTHAVEAIRGASAGTAVRVHLLGDYYPAGDEYDLVHEVTGKLIPPAGIPLQVGVVVCNVETLANIARAADGTPVTRKTLTIAGAVQEPVTLTVPLGTSLRDCIAAAGGATVPDPVLCIGGMLMGETTDDLDRPVTKTTGGAIVLSRQHHAVERKLKPAVAQRAIGKSACDQCRYCTEYCPRFLLGYAVEPHQVMRSLAFTATGKDHWNEWAALCCACGLCTLYACPEELFPKEACDDSKAEMRRAGLKWSGATTVKPHPMRDGRRVPIQSLMKRLHILGYDHPAPWQSRVLTPSRLVLPLKQSAGTAVRPGVKAGDHVSAGQRLGDVAEKELGAALHAPADGTVAEITDRHLVLQCR
ncbi:MAG: 4Fe-4S dicluster domain-containing protein [Opitutaceae bacterium]|nr:4Fe-4S dicluster domain-containing protein [Opitutaceae bacterium]